MAPQVLTSPVKPLSDKKEYRVVHLPNGLTALLISDLASLKGECRKEQIEDDELFNSNAEEMESYLKEEEEESENEDEGPTDEDDTPRKYSSSNSTQYQPAASLSIGVGGFEDPFEIPGLMHFLEHMVFMGSEKYPKENHFDVFIKKHGGYDNAHTDTESTTFYFGVQEEYFKKGLDIFSNFFVSPLMKIDSMERERDAVHSEFELSKQDDDERSQQLFSLLSIDGHPMSKFWTGNEDTLNFNISKEELHKKLHELRYKYYSAQYMTLAVQARESLDTLQEWVVDIFSKIPNNNLPRPSYTNLSFPFPRERIHKLYRIIPVRDFHSVMLTWALPSQLKHYKYKPVSYISHFLGDEGIGSILSYLKKRDWAVALEAGNSGSGYEENSTCSIVCITVYLTNEGFLHLREILLVIFQYLKLMQSIGAIEWAFNELKNVEQLNFDYEAESSPIDNVENLSESMLYYPSEHYLSGDSLMYDFNPEVILQCLSLLTPDSCNLMILSKEYEQLDICNATEKWYGTKYCMEAIPSDWLQEWKQPPPNPELAIPEPNLFIPNDFSLSSFPHPPKEPLRLLKNSQGELWYKPDTEFKLPRAYCNILFRMECVKSSSKMATVLDLFLSLYQQQIQELIYPATVAKYSCSIQSAFPGFAIKINGFNQNLPKCLEILLSQIDAFKSLLQESTFNQMKLEQMKSYHNCTLSPTILRKDVRLSILQESYWPAAVRLQAIKDITKDDLIHLVEDLFSKCEIRMLVQGNITATSAESLFNTVSQKGNSSGASLCSEMKTRKLNVGSWVARLSAVNKADVNGSVINYYQAGPGTLHTELLNEFIIMAMDEPVFDFLRTKEQLGYCIYSTNRNTFGILGISVTVDLQSNKFRVDHVDKKIEEVLKIISHLLKTMSTKEFNELLEVMKKMKLNVDVTLEEEVSRNWNEILDGEYIFNRLEKQIEEIPKITQSEVVSRFHKMINQKDDEYRKLSVQVIGAANIKGKSAPSLEYTTNLPLEKLIEFTNESKKESSKLNFINNLEDFKKELKLYPVTKILS